MLVEHTLSIMKDELKMPDKFDTHVISYSPALLKKLEQGYDLIQSWAYDLVPVVLFNAPQLDV